MHSTDLGDIITTLFGVGASIVTPTICALIAALIYAHKGKPWLGGALLGFFLGPLGVIIALMSAGVGWRRMYMPRPPPPPPQRMKMYAPPPPPPPQPKIEYRLPGRCPYCNGPIHHRQSGQKSVRCFYCGSQVEGTLVQVF